MNTTTAADNVAVDADNSTSPLLVVEDIHTSFMVPGGEVKAVRGVSFELNQGKTLGVVGESGSGKTVLARSVMRLNLGNNVITSGSAKFRGSNILDLRPKAMQKLWGNEIAMVFQDPMTALNPLVKVGRQVTEHVRHHLGISKKEARSLAIDLLNEVRIPEPENRLDSYPHELSGGMRQRICIAIALACEPTLLFADEPTTALDVTVQHQILNLLNREQETREMGMVLVTHDLGVVAGRTDETMVMYAGNVVEKSSTKELFEDMQHPYTEALFRSIPKTNERSHTRLTAIAGRPPDLIAPPSGCSFSPRCPYVQQKCREEEPPLIPVNNGSHFSACWFPVGTEENQEAFRKNVAAGLPQTLVIEETLTKSSEKEDGV
ncbi:MAG: ABC transporter ATP-binding protein [Acidimicrobiales bacterium]|nr:ABC transporter ATP-binding protein [Acidimicrobiales bacterium]